MLIYIQLPSSNKYLHTYSRLYIITKLLKSNVKTPIYSKGILISNAKTALIKRPYIPTVLIGGARRDRTADPLLAKQTLSQLSYGPAILHAPTSKLVGLGGFEPPTSPLSGVRSNQLSYRPADPHIEKIV